MPRFVVVGLLQGPVAWLALAAAISLGLQAGTGARASATIGVSLLAGALAWAALGLLGNAIGRWRERRAILGGVAGDAPRDGAAAVLVGTLEPLSSVIEAPFDGARCLLYAYDVTFDRGSGRRRSVGTVARGAAMAPCAVATRSGSYRLLAVPDLEAEPAAGSRETQLARFVAYAARTTFRQADGSADELQARWSDHDGEYRGDVAFVALDGDTSSWALRQQHVPAGARVCAFGRYSARRGGLVAPLGSSMRVITGSVDAVAGTLGSQMRVRAVLGVVFGAAAAIVLWLFTPA